MPKGLILLAHGARDPRWREPFERLRQRVIVRRHDVDVRLAFLELMPPGLVTAGEELAAGGCDAVIVVPVFLGQGGHVRDDVPALVDTLRRRLVDVTVTQTDAAGEDDEVLEALASFCLRRLDRQK